MTRLQPANGDAKPRSKDDRIPVQRTRKGETEGGIPDRDVGPGSITWEEHQAVWEAYAKKFGRYQSAARLAQRGGFGYGEIIWLTGEEPKTWRAACPKCRRYACEGCEVAT